jgi:hypothetical protein
MMASATPRSVLWIGRIEAMATSQLVASPLFDIAWCRTVAEALRLPLPAFDGVILPGRRGAERLLASGARIVIGERDPDPGRTQEILRTGATAVPTAQAIPMEGDKAEEAPP